VKPEGNSLLGRSIHKWEDNIKMDLREIGYSSMDWVHLEHYKDSEHGNNISGFIK
jgi:hypothetical protein